MRKHWDWLALVLLLSIVITVLALNRHRREGAARGENEWERLAREYVAATEGWPESAYTVQNTHTKDKGQLVVKVIHRDDLRRPGVGGGKSMQLHIDTEQRRVVRVFRYQ